MKRLLCLTLFFIPALVFSQKSDSLSYAVLFTNDKFVFDVSYSNGKKESLESTLHFPVQRNSIDAVKNSHDEYQQFLFRAFEYIEKQGYELVTADVLPYSPGYHEFYFRKRVQK